MAEHLSSYALERRAESLFQGSTREAAALREVASKRGMKTNILSQGLVGLVDSTQTAADLEAKSVQKTGVGYKAWGGLALLAIGAVSGALADSQTSHKAYKRLETIADLSLTLSNAALGVEAYNLGVTRFGRVRQAAEQVVQGLPVNVAGIPSQAMRPGLPARVGAVSPMAIRRVAKRLIRSIDPDDVERIADVFGIDEDEGAALFVRRQDDDDDDEFLPVIDL